ncbi:BTB/POZ and MATH domain-containing protein 3-like [Panicum virgatum]|uniref:BTB/POZ and MATH domain-containing protein 3-like n=1 Tax=Panicum virgatum TaxID=38727 RepID=UPI0019D4F2AE|nr:BTB/POZ and MATH domain-containing protein 3-like [Panicum virgatum]
MASSPNTKSTSTPETVRGEHQFDVAGYSRKQGAGAGTVLTSATFAAGGFDWAIRYYPNGKGNDEFVSTFVRLVTPNATTRALFDPRLVDRATGLPRSVRRSTAPVAFGAGRAGKRERGARTFMARAELAASLALLAARSPVLNAELSGPPAKEEEGAGEAVAVDGVTPLVFRTLLHFIYTDALPGLGDLGLWSTENWLKQICRAILQEELDAETVAAALDSAGQNRHCQDLGDGCVQFMPSSGLEG